jgi:hypothetical protein
MVDCFVEKFSPTDPSDISTNQVAHNTKRSVKYFADGKSYDPDPVLSRVSIGKTQQAQHHQDGAAKGK